MEIIRKQDYRVNDWSGGTTRELFIHPAGSTLAARDFDIRISSAVIQQTESRFSDFSGFTRYIMPLKGDMRLTVGGETIRLQPHRLFRFSGSDEVKSENTPGAVDFNVIVRSGLAVGTAVVSSIDEPSAVGKSVVFALEDITVNGCRLPQGDTAVVDGPVRIDGLAVRVRLSDNADYDK
ncbi:HutD/Ves family protein [Prevotella dentasini]|uniref:HutD/Ves family protein n=1 Tax=Prevotella dentasini TaxID=589537 RepID=UPI00046A502F|nr:HutD family protein [Prevotella dentasini]